MGWRRYGDDVRVVAGSRSGARRASVVASVVAGLSVAAVWWSTRGSVSRLAHGKWFCDAASPMSLPCRPEWHVQVSVLLTALIVAVGVGAVVVVRRTPWRVVPIVVAALVGLLAWYVATQPSRFLPVW